MNASRSDGTNRRDEDDWRQHARVHESGHAVSNTAAGREVTRVRAVSAGTTAVRTPSNSTDDDILREMVGTAGGQAAERLLLGRCHPDGGKDDVDRIAALRRQYPRLQDRIDRAIEQADIAVRLNAALLRDLEERLRVVPATLEGDELKGYLVRVVPLREKPGDRPAPPIKPGSGTARDECA